MYQQCAQTSNKRVHLHFLQLPYSAYILEAYMSQVLLALRGSPWLLNRKMSALLSFCVKTRTAIHNSNTVFLSL